MKETAIESPNSILSKEDTIYNVLASHQTLMPVWQSWHVPRCSPLRRLKEGHTLTLLPDKLIPPTFQTSPVQSPPLHSPLAEVGSPSPRTFRGSGAAVDCSTKMASRAGFLALALKEGLSHRKYVSVTLYYVHICMICEWNLCKYVDICICCMFNIYTLSSYGELAIFTLYILLWGPYGPVLDMNGLGNASLIQRRNVFKISQDFDSARVSAMMCHPFVKITFLEISLLHDCWDVSSFWVHVARLLCNIPTFV